MIDECSDAGPGFFGYGGWSKNRPKHLEEMQQELFHDERISTAVVKSIGRALRRCHVQTAYSLLVRLAYVRGYKLFFSYGGRTQGNGAGTGLNLLLIRDRDAAEGRHVRGTGRKAAPAARALRSPRLSYPRGRPIPEIDEGHARRRPATPDGILHPLCGARCSCATAMHKKPAGSVEATAGWVHFGTDLGVDVVGVRGLEPRTSAWSLTARARVKVLAVAAPVEEVLIVLMSL